MKSEPSPYRRTQDGYTFLLERRDVETLKSLPDFEGREEPAVAEEFLRFRVEGWAEALADAGAVPDEFRARIDSHQRKVHLVRGSTIVISADI